MKNLTTEQKIETLLAQVSTPKTEDQANEYRKQVLAMMEVAEFCKNAATPERVDFWETKRSGLRDAFDSNI